MNKPSPFSAPRRGFTLVEVLLSLALLLLVLAAGYAGMELMRRATTAGRADALRAQLERALEQRISADLRGVVYTPPQPAEETAAAASSTLAQTTAGVGAADDAAGTTTAGAGGAGGGTASQGAGTASTAGNADAATTTSQSATTAPADAFVAAAAGLYGDAGTLVVHVSRPVRSLTLAAAGPNTPAAAGGDLRSVSYFLGTAATGPGSAGAVPGLARRDGERRAIEAATAAGNDALLASQTAVLAPEVVSLQFRYFDGLAWLDGWDTGAAGRLPRAVEVTLGLAVEDAERPKSARGLTADQKLAQITRPHRFVVFLPLSETPPLEDGL